MCCQLSNQPACLLSGYCVEISHTCIVPENLEFCMTKAAALLPCVCVSCTASTGPLQPCSRFPSCSSCPCPKPCCCSPCQNTCTAAGALCRTPARPQNLKKSRRSSGSGSSCVTCLFAVGAAATAAPRCTYACSQAAVPHRTCSSADTAHASHAHCAGQQRVAGAVVWCRPSTKPLAACNSRPTHGLDAPYGPCSRARRVCSPHTAATDALTASSIRPAPCHSAKPATGSAHTAYTAHAASTAAGQRCRSRRSRP